MHRAKLNLPRIPDVVAHRLETRILEGSLKPGDRLPSERELAGELGVSRPSLREAIQKLVTRELLISRHGGGTYVTDRLASSLLGPWQRLMDQHSCFQEDVFEFRYLLESSAAELAAQRATNDDLQRIEEAYARLAAAYAGKDRSTQVAADVAFHLTVAETAHNALYGHLVGSLMRVLHEHVRRTLRDIAMSVEDGRQLMAQHSAIRDAIRARRPAEARRAAQDHISFVRRRLCEVIRLRDGQAQPRPSPEGTNEA